MNINEMIENADKAIASFVPKTSFEYITIAAYTVQSGDMLSGATKGAGEKVEAVKVTDKKAHVTLQGKKTPVAFDRSEPITVGRHIETDVSKEAREALREERRSLVSLQWGAAEPTEAKAKLSTYLAEGWYERVAEVAADIAAGEQVRGLFMNTVDALEAGRYESATEAVAKLTAELTRQCLSGNDTPTWSGGFSVKNAVIQATGEARREAIQKFGRGW